MDSDRTDRRNSNSYSLKEIENALKNKEKIYTLAEQGNLSLIDVVIDAEEAVRQARPTQIQAMTVDLVWKEGYSLVEAGNLLGVSPQAVRFNLNLLKVKITKVLEGWKRELVGDPK